MLKVWLGALKRLDWGISFWRFALAYLLIPWAALGACLRMRRNGRPWPLLLRLSHFAVNHLFLALQLLMLWLWIRAVTGADWVAVVLLPLAVLSNFALLVTRLQTVYMLSRETRANVR